MDSRNVEDKSLKRFNLFLPINSNTEPHIANILRIIKESFNGCTFSRYHLPPMSIGSQYLKGYFIGKWGNYEEDVCIITVDVSESEYSNMYDDLSAIIKRIKHMGEEAVWLTYHDIMLLSEEQKLS